MAHERLTIGQVAARYDVSTDAVRRRIRRGLLPARRDNHGQWWVELDPDAPPPTSLAPTRPPVDARLPPAVAPPAPARQTPPLVPTAAEPVEWRERAAAAEGEARGLREALRVAENAAADARRRAESAECAAVDAWRTAADLAARLAPVRPSAASVPPPPAPPRWKGLVARLLGW